MELDPKTELAVGLSTIMAHPPHPAVAVAMGTNGDKSFRTGAQSESGLQELGALRILATGPQVTQRTLNPLMSGAIARGPRTS